VRPNVSTPTVLRDTREAQLNVCGANAGPK
jgi:hypothetical protein